MKWIKFRIKTRTEAEDIIISTLYDIGLEGAQIEDKTPLTAYEKEQMFVDILPEAEEDDGIAYLNFFVEDNGSIDIEEMRRQVEKELEGLRMFSDIGEGAVTIEETQDTDWINNWKAYFHQFYIDDLLVVPSWEEIKEEDRGRMVLHIDPGTAFGTGMHETTQLCIRQLRKYIAPGQKMLDIGCGSGILSILALLFGAKKAAGTDLDPCALDACEENRKANGIAKEDFTVLIGNIMTDCTVRETLGYEAYDIAAANILAEALVPLTPAIVRHLKPGGIYIASGIIEGKEEIVAQAMRAAGLAVLETTRQGEWASVTAQKGGADTE